VPRSLVYYIVTEYGMTRMIKGLSNWQRAEELINVAHPSFRDELIKEAQQNKIWRKSNKIKYDKGDSLYDDQRSSNCK